ncbi:MAG: DNA translocase FtsK 4TM domain-containing protein, partial [Sedimentisphaerales bacterium]|nr:DNA translocase FtsK 4TM domain-containing protein [Sedimentisphaerales bacterium]
MEARQAMNRLMLTFLALALSVFTLVSLVSFNVCDWPNPDVAPSMVQHNLCGRAGAFIAYHLNYYVGPSSMVLAMVAIIWVALYGMNKPIEQWILRVIGVALVCAVISALAYLIRPGSVNSLSHGNGGVLGIALGHFLKVNADMTGAILILGATLLVGLLLAADNVIMLLPTVLGRAI